MGKRCPCGRDVNTPFCPGCGRPALATREQIATRARFAQRWARLLYIEAKLDALAAIFRIPGWPAR